MSAPIPAQTCPTLPGHETRSAMMQLPRLSPRLARVLATGFGVALIGGVVAAQTVPAPAIEWNERRLERLERNVRKLEHALTQRNAAGAPASLLEPDPEVVALMS